MASASTTKTILALLAVANCVLGNVIVQRPTLVTYHHQPGYPQPLPAGPGQTPVLVQQYPPGAGPPLYQPGQPQPPLVLVPVGPGYPGLYPPPQGVPGGPGGPVGPDGTGGHHGPPFIEEVIPVLKDVPSVDDEEKKKRPHKGTDKCNGVDNKKGIPAPPTDHVTSGSRKSRRAHEKEGARMRATRRPSRVNPKNERLVKSG
ncbi:unnamed protein product [Ixodes hexagonus]